MGRFPTYVVTMLALDLLGVSLAAGLFPPDAAAQTYALGVTLVAAPVVAYWLVYREGFERFGLRRLLGRDGRAEGGANDGREPDADEPNRD
jgi:O-antigen/teichoic acid export membrane protein